MIIPHEQLRPATLQSLIEEFITREGSVHGHRETPLPVMVEQVLEQLRTGRVVIVFDDVQETCGIVTAHQAAQRAVAAAVPEFRGDSSEILPDA